MVQALDRKTVTRRTTKLDIVNQDPSAWNFIHLGDYQGKRNSGKIVSRYGALFQHKETLEVVDIPCPYGRPTYILWVRETWRKYHPVYANGYTDFGREIIEFAADNPPLIPMIDPDGFQMCNKDGSEKFIPWKPSIHMPKAACRQKLKITAVGVERLHDITEEDAIREGVKFDQDSGYFFVSDEIMASSAVQAFAELWIMINGLDSWNNNPWVWRVQIYKMEQANKVKQP